MQYVFKHDYRQNHSTLLNIIDLLFTWIQKHSKKTGDRGTVVYRRWEDRFVHIRKKMVKFFFGSLWTKSEPLGEKRAGKNETNDYQYGPNKVFVIITI